MKILIVGRNGVGKKTLADWLSAFGLDQAQTYTTKAPRSMDDISHIFINESEIDEIDDKIAVTKVNGNTYFTTREQVEESDFLIVDPKGASEIMKEFSDISFTVVRMTADPEKVREMTIRNAVFPDAEEKVYDQKLAEEDKMFADFEKKWDAGEYDIPPFTNIFDVFNGFLPDQSDLEESAARLRGYLHRADNVEFMVLMLMADGALEIDEDENIVCRLEDGGTMALTLDQFVYVALSDMSLLGAVCFDFAGMPEVLMGDSIYRAQEEAEEYGMDEEEEDFEVLSDE